MHFNHDKNENVMGNFFKEMKILETNLLSKVRCFAYEKKITDNQSKNLKMQKFVIYGKKNSLTNQIERCY